MLRPSPPWQQWPRPPSAARPAPNPFAPAEKRASQTAPPVFPFPPATPRHKTAIRLLHKLSTWKIKALSPEIFHAAVLFPCATRGRRANVSLPQRIARHRAGREGLRNRRREDRASAGSELRNARNAGGSWNVFGRETFAGGERAGAGSWKVFGPEAAVGVLRNHSQLVGRPGNGRSDQEGVRGAARHMRRPRLSTWRLFGFRAAQNETGPACMQGVPSASEMHTASVAPVPLAIAQERLEFNHILRSVAHMRSDCRSAAFHATLSPGWVFRIGS